MDGKTVVVTGANRGLGAAVARAFADAGARVVCGARDREALEDVVSGITGSGGEADAIRADVRDEFDLERLMEVAARGRGALDVVVPNAAVRHGPLGEVPLDAESYSAFDDTLRTNLRGVFATVKEALPHLAGDGRVLVPSGSVARDPSPGMGAYAVSKAGAEAVARGFAADLDVPVGVVDPGTVATDLSEGRGRDPERAAQMFVWAATDLDAADLDGEIVDVGAWRSATR
jgi:hypothetical protein